MSGMKGRIKADHIPQNKYTFRVSGLPPIEFLRVEGLEEELEVVDLPDRTRASGGNTKAGEITVEIMMHHTIEVNAMEQWFRQSQDPVSRDYKRDGVLVLKSLSGLASKTWQLKGCFPSKRTNSNVSMANEGEPVTQTWVICWDDIKKLGNA